MKSSSLHALLAACTALPLFAAPVSAQSDILLRLRSGSPAGDRFRVDSAGGFVAIGQLGIGIIPQSGDGWRTMWHPFKGAFRSGNALAGSWDDANVGFYSWAGGSGTIASQYASFAFGDGSDATANYSVAFGYQTQVSGAYGFGAGYQSRCTGLACTAFGYIANADGQGAVALGYRVTADANYSVAMGYRGSTNGHQGAFAFSDASTTDSLEASANNQFNGRFAGGYRLYTNATTTTGVALNAGGSSWNVISDRNRKENFLGLDGEFVLERLRDVPVTMWNYIDEGRHVRHIGPMAQDWHRAFALNDDSLTINQGDFDGVNLAAIRALEQRTAALQAAHAELAAKARRIEELEARLARIEALLAAPPPR
jgi:hypothetical protein